MPNDEITVWGIHGGKTGDADTHFLKNNCIGLGWASMGDLSKLDTDREAFKSAVREKYPEKTAGGGLKKAGQLFRFVHGMKNGDIVIYPSKRDRQIHIGKIAGDYKYDSKKEPGYPHVRPVKWLKEISRTKFSQGALYEIGSAMSFFQVKTYADEFLSALEGEIQPTPVKKDVTVVEVSKNIEENTRDFILKQLAQELKGHPLSDFVAHLLETMEYKTRISPEGPDGGIDIIAHKDELGFVPPIVKVQVKSSEGSIGDPIVSALYGKVASGEYGLLVTLGKFTSQAINFAKSKSNLRLIDGDELVSLILEHYEQFNSMYKGLLPLKKVYIPELIDETEE